MKVEEIEKLLAEFYNGNTDEQEEERLKEAFQTEDVPSHLEKDKKLFLGLFCREVEEENMPVGLGAKLGRMIDEKYEEEQHFFRRNKTRRNWYWVGGIAATILLLIGIGYALPDMDRSLCSATTPQDTFSDPEVAYKALQATLIEVSANLNKGIEQVEATQQDMTKVNLEIKNEFQR